MNVNPRDFLGKRIRYRDRLWQTNSVRFRASSQILVLRLENDVHVTLSVPEQDWANVEILPGR